MKIISLKHISLLAMTFLLLIAEGCKKLVEVDLPPDKITDETVYANTNTSVAAINSVYADMSDLMGATMSYNAGLVSDELTPSSPIYGGADYLNNFADPSSSFFSLWNICYNNGIYRLNSLIKGVSESTGIPQSARVTLISEAKFTRAFLYFLLINYYGDVPLVLTTDFKVNSNIPRSSVEVIYQQIVNDLNEAARDLPASYLGPDLKSTTSDRVRPTKMAATALLARVYLFHQDWPRAEQEASKTISSSLFSLTTISDVFKKNSMETIWALQPNLQLVAGHSNGTPEGRALVPISGANPNVLLSNDLYSSFENDDKRKTNWVGTIVNGGVQYRYAFKYKIGSNISTDIQQQDEFSILLRLSEQYLIRAEARAQLGKLSGTGSAKEDLDMVRTRAGLMGSSASSQQELLRSIWHERRVELFLEWGGFRWLDLKRTGTVDIVMGEVTPSKGGTWASYKALLPIPYYEFTTNPALRGHQNPGYPERL